MADLTPDQAIQTLRGLPEDRQRAILGKLSPDVKRGIMSKLSAPQQPQPEARTFGNYAAEGAEGIGRGLANSVTGIAQTVAHPIDTLTGLVSQAGTAVSDAAKEFRDTSGAPLTQRVGAAALTGLEDAPVIGGMVQHAEQGGERMGSPEAFGAAMEGVTSLEAPKLIGPLTRQLAKVPEMARGVAQASVGAGEKATRGTVADAATAAAKAREDVLAKNKAADEQTLKDRGKVDEYNDRVAAHNATVASKNASVLSEADQVKQQIARRADAQKELNDVSSRMDVAVEKARHDALEEGNKKYSAVNEKLNNMDADPDAIPSALGDAAEKIKGSLTEPPIFKDMLKRVDKGDSFTYEDLQGYYSELGKELSKGTLPGDIYTAYDTLHENIGNEMQRIADENGQGAQLMDARNYWRRMKQTFGKSSDTIRDRASKAVKGVNPDLIKQQASEYRTRLLSSFDPSIEGLASRAKSLQDEIKSLPSKSSSASEVVPKTTKNYAEPQGAKPVEKPELSTREIREKALDRWAKGEEGLNKWQVRALVAGPIGGIVGAMLGHGEGGAIGYGLGSAIGPAMVAKLVERPGVREWLTRPPAGELAALQQLPNADRIALTDTLRKTAQVAQQTGTKVSPLIFQALEIAAPAAAVAPLGPRTKQLQEMRGSPQTIYTGTTTGVQ